MCVKKTSRKKSASNPHPTEPKAVAPFAPPTLRYIPALDVLKDAPYNPREVTPVQLNAIARSIVEFGFVDPFVARDDGLLLGGHQRKKGIALLLGGPFKFRGPSRGEQLDELVERLTTTGFEPIVEGGKSEGPKMITVTWKPPIEGYPVMYLTGISDRRAKLLNLALNKATGDWEHDRLASLLHSLSTGDDALDINALGVSGFSPAELTDYIDIAEERIRIDDGTLDMAGSGGEIPAPSKQAPKLALDFASKDLRDEVKKAIGAAAKGDEASGETLARMLNIRAPRKAKKR